MKGMSTTEKSSAEENVPPRVIVERRGLTNGMKWFILLDGTFLIFILLAVLSGPVARSDTVSVLRPMPTSSAAQGGNAAQQSGATAPVPSVNSTAPMPQPIQTVLAYSNNDYVVGTGEGQIAPGLYQCNGDNNGFKFSTWTSYTDMGKEHIRDFGSIGEGQHRFMTVAQDAKVVSLTGDAVWIKAG